MTVSSGPLQESYRAIAGGALQATLVDLLNLSLVAKQAHWNLYGGRASAPSTSSSPRW